MKIYHQNTNFCDDAIRMMTFKKKPKAAADSQILMKGNGMFEIE